MQQAKNALLNDIDAYARAPGPESYADWLAATAVKYDAWLQRLRQ